MAEFVVLVPKFRRIFEGVFEDLSTDVLRHMGRITDHLTCLSGVKGALSIAGGNHSLTI